MEVDDISCFEFRNTMLSTRNAFYNHEALESAFSIIIVYYLFYSFLFVVLFMFLGTKYLLY